MGGAFLPGFLLARELKQLQGDLVSVAGAWLRANASKHNSIRHDPTMARRERGLEQMEAEWVLVPLTDDCKRLNKMRLA